MPLTCSENATTTVRLTYRYFHQSFQVSLLLFSLFLCARVNNSHKIQGGSSGHVATSPLMTYNLTMQSLVGNYYLHQKYIPQEKVIRR